MDKKKFYQASIVDELAHLMETPLNTSITQGWTFTLEGELSSPSIREALDRCLTLYPKLACTLTKDYPSLKRAFRYSWNYRNDITSSAIFEEIEDSNPDHRSKDTLSYYRDYHHSHYIDITREPPIKVLLIRQSERSHLIFFVHHAGVDGIGFLLFFQSFIEFYEDSIYQREKESGGTPDFKGISKPHIPFQWKHFLPQHLSVYRKYGVLKEQVHVAHQDGEEGGNSMEKLLAIDRELSPEQFSTFRATAKKHQVTINDYLLASMFQTVKTWNRQRNEQPGRIYLDVPVNLRSPEDRTLGNIMCGFRIFLTPESIGTKEETLRLVKKKRSFMMKQQIAQKMVEFAWVLKPLPLSLKKLLYSLHPDTYCPTLTMSNIGICNPNPSHKDDDGFHYLGSARIRSMCFIGYAAPWPQLIALTYNNRMRISLSVFRSQFSLESAEAFLDSFIDTINEQQ
jgi:NRPS condensation-like uncharacterized protein